MTSLYPPSVMFPLGVPSFPATFPAVTITPSSVTVASRASQTFVGGGGVAPYTYSIHVNNSGGTIDAGTGVYTAGPVASNVSDTVRATDTNSSFADASVSVTALVPSMTGLKLWLDAAKGIGIVSGGVDSWTDQSGSGNNMAHGIQRPTLTASAINGLPGVTFTGTNQSMQNVTSNILTAGSDRTVMAVVIPTTGTGTFNPGGTVFGFRLGANAWILYLGTTAGTTYGYSSTVATDSLSSPPTIANVAALVECSGTLGGQPTFIHNATTYALTAGVIGNETGTTGFMVGNNPSFATTFNFNGSICELFVYDHVCDAGELAATRAYVEAKYAIALGEP